MSKLYTVPIEEKISKKDLKKLTRDLDKELKKGKKDATLCNNS